MATIPDVRIRTCNSETLREKGDFVLYWMIASRRLGWNFALEQAAGHARQLGKPLVILEPLRCGYRWANDRIHRFVIDGMAEHDEAPRAVERPLSPLRRARARRGTGAARGARAGGPAWW